MSHSKIEIETARTEWPGRSDRILEQILTHEDELDIIWPGWREKKPFNRCAYDLLARIKWLLKKRAMLTRTEHGQPAPQEWDVMIVRDGRNPRKCYAHPVTPPLEARPDVTRNPPSPLAEVS